MNYTEVIPTCPPSETFIATYCSFSYVNSTKQISVEQIAIFQTKLKSVIGSYTEMIDNITDYISVNLANHKTQNGD